LGDRYIHGFGTIGHDYGLLPFYQYWLKSFLAGKAADIGAYSLNTAAAPRGKFMAPATDVPPNSPSPISRTPITLTPDSMRSIYAAMPRRAA